MFIFLAERNIRSNIYLYLLKFYNPTFSAGLKIEKNNFFNKNKLLIFMGVYAGISTHDLEIGGQAERVWNHGHTDPPI